MDFLRPYLSRIIAAALAAGIGYVATKLGLEMTQEQQVALAGSLGTFVTLVVFAITHKTIDKKVNPGDNASSHLAVINKAKAKALKGQTHQAGYMRDHGDEG